MNTTNTFKMRIKALGINLETLKSTNCPVCNVSDLQCTFCVFEGVFNIKCNICDERAQGHDFVTAIYHFNWRSSIENMESNNCIIDEL